MAAAMNGMALHGGIIPYSGTFLQFTDYCRPSIRLAALMRQRVVWVMTHDSIGLGEDGPTHQPVEHLSALRAIPNLLVLRPADPLEVAECWQVALAQTSRPSLLVLTRQSVPTLRLTATEQENWSRRGGYVLQGMRDDKRDITLLATGSEVEIAAAARAELRQHDIHAAVVSMPSFELFAEQAADYQAVTLGETPRIAIEAATRMSWEKYLRGNDAFIGMNDFGASAPSPALYQHFGITAAATVAKARALLGR
jgi:transketolase